MNRLPWIAIVIVAGSQQFAVAQQPYFSSIPTQTVYEYQLNYQLPWQRYFGGPGLSLGGTMPTQGAIGFSSLNGLPFPPPLGAGVYVNPTGPFMPGFPGPFPAMVPGAPMPGAPVTRAPLPGVPNPSVLPRGAAMPGSAPARQASHSAPRARQVQSPPGARRSSMEQQRLGDEKLRQHFWPQAYVHYRNAVDQAPERPEAHFRLGLAFAAMKQFASAIREFKRSIDIDPTIPQSGELFPAIFGPDNDGMQSILPPVASWAQEDLRDANRLFLLGLILHFSDDPRGSEILEAAARISGSNQYISAFLNPDNPRTTERPHARQKENAPPQPRPEATESPATDFPPAPVPPAPAPMPDENELLPLPAPLPLP